MTVARKLLAIVSDSGEPIVSLTTDRKLLTPITTAIAVVSSTSRRAVLDPIEISRQFGSFGATARRSPAG